MEKNTETSRVVSRAGLFQVRFGLKVDEMSSMIYALALCLTFWRGKSVMIDVALKLWMTTSFKHQYDYYCTITIHHNWSAVRCLFSPNMCNNCTHFQTNLTFGPDFRFKSVFGFGPAVLVGPKKISQKNIVQHFFSDWSPDTTEEWAAFATRILLIISDGFIGVAFITSFVALCIGSNKRSTILRTTGAFNIVGGQRIFWYVISNEQGHVNEFEIDLIWW